ncbi:MAG: photosystem II protein Psb27 [Pseudanabaenaceae cyanobacterium]
MRYLVRVLAIGLAVWILFINVPAEAGLFGKEATKTTREIFKELNAGLTGNYVEDTTAVIKSLRYAVNLDKNAPDRTQAETDAHFKINAYAARYRINSEQAGLYSYTTMRTVLNTLAGYFNGNSRKTIPEKTKERVLKELEWAEAALAEGR